VLYVISVVDLFLLSTLRVLRGTILFESERPMNSTSLSLAVENFASLTHLFSDADLERPWAWKDYEEGVRFSFFRTCEQLDALAIRLDIERAASPHPFTIAQRILGQYHTAYRDSQAVLLGGTDEQAARIPAEGEWPLRQVLAHIVQADRGFFTAILLGLEHIRKGNTEPFQITEEIWNNFWADAPFSDLAENGSLSQIQAYYATLHARILRKFSSLTNADLDLPLHYWESEPFSLEFRLHRFSLHLRQHTIQAEKTLAMLSLPPSETSRLLRIIYQALAAVENTTIGEESFGLDRQAQLAVEIEQRGAEIAQVVG
jgi:uncharacterized damage-inducible protein DinB